MRFEEERSVSLGLDPGDLAALAGQAERGVGEDYG
jgi:hypothetical protein